MRLIVRIGSIIVLFLVGLAITATVFPLLAELFTADRACRYKNTIKIRWLRCFGGIIGLRVRRQGRPAERSALMVSNHISWLDVLVVGRYSPGCFIAKSDVADWPVIGYLAGQAGTLFIRRGETRQLHAVCEKIAREFKAQRAVIAFPEGTTSRGDRLLPFHASLFQPAAAAGADVQPVAISYCGKARALAPFIGDDAFVPHLLKLLTLRRIEVRVDFLPSLKAGELHRQALSRQARDAIETALAVQLQTAPADKAPSPPSLLPSWEPPLAIFDKDPEF